MKRFLFIIIFVGIFTVLMFLFRHPGPGIFRSIASFDKEILGLQISETDAVQRIRKQKFRILQNISFDETQSLLRFGAFVMGDSGKSICDLYPNIELTFRAEGVITNGVAAMIHIQTPCLYSVGDDQIQNIVLPTAEILALVPKDQNYQDANGQNIQIEYVEDFWPEEWHLFGLNFTSSDLNQKLSIDSYEVNYVLGKPLAWMLKPKAQ